MISIRKLHTIIYILYFMNGYNMYVLVPSSAGSLLTLIDMRGYTLISLSFLDQILSGKFLSKIWEVKIDINRVNLTPCQAH